MNVLFLTLLDFSSIGERGIYTDLMREFVKANHRLYIISPTERKKKEPTRIIYDDKTVLLKLRIGNMQKTNIFEKGISTLTVEYLFLFGIKQFFSDVKFDLIIYSTPPITLQSAVEYVKKRDQAKTYLLLKDIFPQNAVDIGLMKTNSYYYFIYRYFKLKEEKIYSISDYIGCMSQANVDYILKHNPRIPIDKVEVCPNSIEPITPSSYVDKLEIMRQLGIPANKTIFLYGGNLGKPQGIDFLIECLKQNEENINTFFMIIGSGTEYSKLERYFAEYLPKNAKLMKQLPSHEYDKLVQLCDVGLIFLDYRFTIPNFPSRILSYMQASKPVLAATDLNTDLGKVLTEGEFGFWCESKNVDSFNKLVNKLCDSNMRYKLGKNARKYLERFYIAERSYDIIIKHFI